MEKIVVTIQKSGKKVETLDELRIDSNILEKYRNILEKDIDDADNNRNNIKEYWKMNKKVNKMRRKKFETNE